VQLPGGTLALFTDTVGFIQKLPTTLVAAFRATLEEVAEAELLLHVIDITHPNAQEQSEAVMETLSEIDADHIPVLTVLNKIDRMDEPETVIETAMADPDMVAVSALKNEGIEDLLHAVHRKLYESFVPLKVQLPFQEGALIALFHEQGQVETVEHTRYGVKIDGRVPERLVARYKAFEGEFDEE
jgi:GTP-binding protein HflX